ncbi:uncharacterized protein LOC135259339 isoform X4 [Anguilla rostrata]|uniref:uncharacterized protein LOC135259339 isoform X4 n=1 Tax=Anguilla rostrata TaxID=7938 RepID=UPI0030D19A7B
MTPAGPVRLRLRDSRLCTERSRRRGDMSHLTVLLCCLILSFLSSCGNNEALTVTQSPPSITVKEGEMAQMLCCWGGTPNIERVRVRWNKTNTSSDIINTLHEKDNATCERKDKYSSCISGNCSEFNISNVSTNDTGVYFCNIHIEIPIHKEGQGSGTQLTVNRINNSSEAEAAGDSVMEAVIFILRCLPFLTLLMAVFYRCRTETKAPAPENKVQEGSVKEDEEEDEALNESSTLLLEAAAPADAEVADGNIGVSCSAPSSDVPNQD